jgi:hypothetical protein
MGYPGEAGRTGGVPRSPGELVFVPAHPGLAGHGEIVPEVRHLAGGRVVLPAFSTLTGLVGALGRFQPWAALPLMRVREMAAAVGAGQVLLDPRIGPRLRRWQPGDVEALRARGPAGPAAGGGPGAGSGAGEETR